MTKSKQAFIVAGVAVASQVTISVLLSFCLPLSIGEARMPIIVALSVFTFIMSVVLLNRLVRVTPPTE